MNEQIKDAFNQIHAPKELVEETKLMLYDKEDKKSHKAAIVILSGIASMAACIIICLYIPYFNPRTNQAQQVSSSLKEFNYGSEGETYIPPNDCYNSSWLYLLNTLQSGDPNTIAMELENTPVYNCSYQYNDELTYRFKFIIQDGTLYYDELCTLKLKGNLIIQIYDNNNTLLNSNSFLLENTNYFINKTPYVNVKDLNNDNKNEIYIDAISSKWYTLDKTYQLIPYN